MTVSRIFPSDAQDLPQVALVVSVQIFQIASVGYPRLTFIEECGYNYYIVHQDLGLCPQVSVSKDSVKQSHKRCTGTLDPVLNIIIKVHCLREVAAEVGKLFDSLQDFPIDGDLWVWANYT